MTEAQKGQVSVFRFGIIHDFVGAIRLDHGEQERLLWRRAHANARHEPDTLAAAPYYAGSASICRKGGSWRPCTRRRETTRGDREC